MNDLLVNETYKEWYKDNIKDTFFKYVLQHIIAPKFIIKVPIYESFSSLLSFTTSYREHFYNNFIIYGDNYQAIAYLYENMLTNYDNSSFSKYENICKFLYHERTFGFINGPPIKNEVKNIFLNYINKSQKTYFSILKFIRICKIKMSKPYNTDDLFMDNINNPCHIFHINKLYNFSKSDIINLFYNALISSNYQFHSSPKVIKNPYTNIKFTYNILVQMYIHYKYYTNIYNNVIEAFFKANFKLKGFISDNDTLLTELNIKRFLNNNNSNPVEIHKFLKEMIEYSNKHIFKKNNALPYCKLFPKHILFNAYKPYLYQYLIYKYSSENTKSYDAFTVFKKKIVRFQKNSPKFGRSILHLPNKTKHYILPFKSKIPDEKYYTYETKFINYYNNNYTEEHCDPVTAKTLKRKYNNYDSDNESVSSEERYDSDTDTDNSNEAIINENNIIDNTEQNSDFTITNFDNDISNIISNIFTLDNQEELVIPFRINGNISENFQINQTDVNYNIIQNDQEN